MPGAATETFSRVLACADVQDAESMLGGAMRRLPAEVHAMEQRPETFWPAADCKQRLTYYIIIIITGMWLQ
jgi:hypothetical protein